MKKILTFLIIVFLIIVLLFVGWFLFFQTKKGTNEEQVAGNKYRNDYYKFEMIYPLDWKMSTIATKTPPYSVLFTIKSEKDADEEVNIDCIDGQVTLTDYFGAGEIQRSLVVDITSNGFIWKKVRRPTHPRDLYAFIQNNGKTYVFSYSCNESNGKNIDARFEQVISNFKFLP